MILRDGQNKQRKKEMCPFVHLIVSALKIVKTNFIKKHVLIPKK